MTGYTVADYLLDRLHELGVDRVFGVPGDYTLALLDHVVAHPGVAWTGCANELNAGYAADGYARIRGLGAVMTTFGVGELSALNAVAGAFAEHVPLVEIVGSPATGSQAAQRIVHHSLGDGVFTHFLDMHAGVTCARAALTPDDATAEIDRVLCTVRDERLPGYLVVPAEVAVAEVDPPDAPLPAAPPETDQEVLSRFTEAAGRLLDAHPDGPVAVLGGLLVHRFGATSVLENLVAAGGLRYATTLWGKSLLDESDPLFAGVYSGAAGDQDARRTVEDAAVTVLAGVQFTDLNSGFFSQHLDRARTVEIDAEMSSVGDELFAPLRLVDALQALVPLVTAIAGGRVPAELGDPAATGATGSTGGPATGGSGRGDATAHRSPAAGTATDDDAADAAPLGQQTLWDTVAAALRTGDIVLADQGTSFYGMATHRLPRGVTFLGQPLWASIGYTLPALLGATLAAPGRRGVLLIGDGAAQMTVQELGTLFALGVPAVVLVVDNDGYTVERAIHGPKQPYNDIPRWDWSRAGDFFGPGRPSRSSRVTTVGALREALAAAEGSTDTVTVIQAAVPPLDVPPLLTSIAQAAALANSRR
ncbi:indolepyruvate decarboxylase [Nakamurella endophytica]|uniref:Alpha-keto-acid decarboxylase n=1 Tax=Nakamurella endophytica TaxID=1748367 RepID=A0A917SNQ7_9ACTN|nr:thiamine pyrophosphate-binding protein [Nakamurella endophytica]GGL91129.1 indolepyruvate decarboxylase [Nakamurella endophytica]